MRIRGKCFSNWVLIQPKTKCPNCGSRLRFNVAGFSDRYLCRGCNSLLSKKKVKINMR